MGGIFISYRRADSAPYAGRLRDALSHRFGDVQVFRDIERINLGAHFPQVLKEAVSSCDALVAVIGPAWLSVEKAGQRRLDDPTDHLRLEIATALSRDDVLLIPVLVESTPMPAREDLPEPLAGLVDLNALRISNDEWDAQVQRLIRTLETVVRPAPSPPAGAETAAPAPSVNVAAGGPGSIAVGGNATGTFTTGARPPTETER